MKPQDILFLLIVCVLILIRKPRLIALSAMVLLLLAIPLYGQWVFFTAHRLVMYSAGLYVLYVLFSLQLKNKVE